MIRYLLSIILIGVSTYSYSQDVEYEVTYNNTTGLYEAYAHVVGGNIIGTGTLTLGASGFSIVVPSSVSNTEIFPSIPSSNTPTGQSWVNNVNEYAPTVTPNLDYRRFNTQSPGSRSFITLDVGESKLLFSFDLGGCVGNVRVFNNGERTSAELGNQDFSNAFVIDSEDEYLDNRNNIGTGCVFIQTNHGDWNVGSNWDQGTVPTFRDTAIIDDGVASTVSSNQDIRNLTTNAGSSVSIGNGITLDVSENLTNNGDFTGEGYVVFDGTLDLTQQIIGDGTDAGSFSNIRLNNTNGLLLTDDADITGVLDIDAGNFEVQRVDVDGPNQDINFLTFKSDDQNNTAVVDEVASGSSIDGCVIVERYIPAKRAFRFLSSPVTTNSAGCNFKPTINDNLQEGLQITNTSQYDNSTDNGVPNNLLGFGTHITGAQNSDTAGINAGLDATNTGNPSMFYYNNGTNATNGSFAPVTSTNGTTAEDNDELSAGQDFLLMVRGDRDLDLNFDNIQTGNATTLRFTGELETGDFTFSSAASVGSLNNSSGAFNVIANPYQAQVSLIDLLTSANNDVQKDQVWVFDPTNADQFGAYVLIEFNVDNVSGNPISIANVTPQSAEEPANNNTGVTTQFLLQPNQSFFIQNSDNEGPLSPTVTFQESQKSNSTSTIAIFSDPNPTLTVQMNLYTASNDLRDGVIVRMGDNFNDDVVEEDALKLFNNLENLATDNNGTLLTSDRRVLDDANENVQLYLGNYTESGYVFKININNPDNKEVYLLDNYLGTQTLLDGTYLEHNFTTDQNVPASIATDRFVLQFNNTTLSNDTFDTDLSGIQVYPNPVENVVNISKGQFNGEWEALSIFDITGKRIINLDKLGSDSELNIDMSTLSNGLYILKVDTSNGQFQQKLLKK